MKIHRRVVLLATSLHFFSLANAAEPDGPSELAALSKFKLCAELALNAGKSAQQIASDCAAEKQLLDAKLAGAAEEILQKLLNQ